LLHGTEWRCKSCSKPLRAVLTDQSHRGAQRACCSSKDSPGRAGHGSLRHAESLLQQLLKNKPLSHLLPLGAQGITAAQSPQFRSEVRWEYPNFANVSPSTRSFYCHTCYHISRQQIGTLKSTRWRASANLSNQAVMQLTRLRWIPPHVIHHLRCSVINASIGFAHSESCNPALCHQGRKVRGAHEATEKGVLGTNCNSTTPTKLQSALRAAAWRRQRH
jgi:hypothetical protein